MGTFTVGYAVRGFLKKYSWVLFGVGPPVYYFGKCWEDHAYDKASLMKGKSNMFAHRHKEVPKNVDLWRY
ncbi:Protein Y38E10A.24 [Aphelenchoides avenae]|nr:Protein Y38E10A.24 [Aphelenchus avenae]